MNESIIFHLLNLKSLVRVISKRGNLSAPGFDDIAFPTHKLEKESAAPMIMTMMRSIIFQGNIFNIWKMNNSFLIHKAGYPNEPGN
jgi:hypothetical protein